MDGSDEIAAIVDLGFILIIVACAMAFTAPEDRLGPLVRRVLHLYHDRVAVGGDRGAIPPGNERAFWFGFAVFGWCFFVLGLGPWPNPSMTAMGWASHSTEPTDVSSILFLVPYLRAET